jgi:RimJ/RimL family protein N-acetyltransferase
MYARVKREAAAHTVSSIYLYVDELNVQAQKVYEKIGMKKSHYVMYGDQL